MNVQELIDELQKVEDKSKNVEIGVHVWNYGLPEMLSEEAAKVLDGEEIVLIVESGDWMMDIK